MIKFKASFDYEIEFSPLENGKGEYIVNFHDYGNLESRLNVVLTYTELNYFLKNYKNAIQENC